MNLHLLENPRALQSHIISSLAERCGCESLFADTECEKVQSSSVMLLLGEQAVENGNRPEICVILNKRSQEVRQPGDLCCPGGTVETTVDPYLARLLALPFSPLSRWPAWKILRRYQRREARLLSLLLAAGLRESWEEMRLNPFAARFLGPLPSQCLLLFRRVIHPMVAYVSWQKNFFPSWEVEKILFIPLRALLNPSHYAVFRLHVPSHLEWRFNGSQLEFPCFLYRHEGHTELLWGVTYRIVTLLLEVLFEFTPPGMARLPLVPAVLDDSYIHGRARCTR